MKLKTEKKLLQLWIDPELYRFYRVYAAEHDTSVRAVIEPLLEKVRANVQKEAK